MLSSRLTDSFNVSATVSEVEESSCTKYDDFGNSLNYNNSTSESDDDSCSLFDCESCDNSDYQSNSEDGKDSFNTSSATGSRNLMKLSRNDYSEPSGQCRLLLVSLLDNFCSMYDRNPKKNQKLFSSLCRKLSSMGILNSLDFMEESKSVRSVYREAFKAIVVEAVKSIESPEKFDLNFPGNSPLSNNSDSFINSSLVEQHTHTFSHFLNNNNEINTIPASSLGEEIFLSGRSRYQEDFVEGVVLGRGGYGKVVIAVNKLDGNSYAIKKINFSAVSSTRFARILREVKSLARLDHPNIVRYNSAWIEDHSVILERTEEVAENENENRPIVHELEYTRHEFNADSDDCADKLGLLRVFEENTEDEDTFTSGLTSDQSSSEFTHVLHAPSSNSNSIVQGSYSGYSVKKHSSHSHTPDNRGNRFQFQDRKVMYIQMELCRFTLDQYIKIRNAFYFKCLEELNRTGSLVKGQHKMVISDKSERSYAIPAENLFIWNEESRELALNPVELDSIFKGIVKGLHYIHENGMIHRDLKPMNIFFHHDLSPKIGDFGLVSEIKCSCGYNCGTGNDSEELASSGVLSPTMIESESHTRGVGTITYASPEQLNQEDYTQKSDIYSLGIICFELFYPVATQMERTRILADLKQRHRFPESFLKQWPKEAAFIWTCIARDSEVRPSTQEILESEWLERDEEEIISRLEAELSMARKREEELLTTIQELRRENFLLKRDLNK